MEKQINTEELLSKAKEELHQREFKDIEEIDIIREGKLIEGTGKSTYSILLDGSRTLLCYPL